MAVAPVNKFLSVAVPVTPGEQKLYEVPTGTSAILLYAQVSNVGINTYPTVTFIHRREARSTGITRDIRIIKDIEVPPNDAAVLVDGRLVLEKTATTLDRLYIKGTQLGIGTITDVQYSPYSGIATVTTMDAHGFSVNDQISMVGIAFTCSSNAGITTTIFPDPQQSSIVESIVDSVGTSKTFTSVIGGTGAQFVDHFYNASPHNFVKAVNNSTITGGDYTHTYKSGLSTSVNAVVMGGNYTHKFVSAAPNCITVVSGGSGSLTPEYADYNPSNGNLKLSFASNPGLSAGGSPAEVSIATTSIIFQCAMDGYGTNHAYPRLGDPAQGQSLPLVGASGTHFTVNVGASVTTGHTPSAAVYTPSTGELVLTIPAGYNLNKSQTTKSAQAGTSYDAQTGILTVTSSNHGLALGQRIRFDDESLTFKCTKDNNVGLHKYPRATDPESRKWLTITSIPDVNNFTVGITSAGADGNYPHTFHNAVNNGIKVAGDSIKIGNNSLVYTCAMDNNATSHSYPRATDPYYDTAISIGDTTTTTISAFVGKSPIKYFNPSNADYNPTTGDLKLTIDAGYNLRGQTLHSITGATYTPTTGQLDLTINSHSFVVGDRIRIQERSLTFTCDKDLRRTQHQYPRQTDPWYNKWLIVTVIDANTIRVNVGQSSNTSTHYYQSSLANCIAKQGASIKLANSGFTFTCAMDGNSTEHAYPRSTDPYYNTSVGIGTTTTDSITVHVGKSPSGGMVGPLQMEFIASILENSTG